MLWIRLPAAHCIVNFRLIAMLIFSGILLTACSRQTRKPSDYQHLPLVKPRSANTIAPEYRLGYGDVVEIKLEGMETLRNNVVSES